MTKTGTHQMKFDSLSARIMSSIAIACKYGDTSPVNVPRTIAVTPIVRFFR